MAKGRGGGKTPERVVELIREAVAKKSQSAVARESGLALLTVQRYLKGVGEPSLETLQKLADYFKVSVPWLRGDVPTTLEQEREYLAGYARVREELGGGSAEDSYESLVEGMVYAIRKKEGVADLERLKEYRELGEVKGFFDKYRNLFVAFLGVPADEMKIVMTLLRGIELMKTEDPHNWARLDYEPPK